MCEEDGGVCFVGDRQGGSNDVVREGVGFCLEVRGPCGGVQVHRVEDYEAEGWRSGGVFGRWRWVGTLVWVGWIGWVGFV